MELSVLQEHLARALTAVGRVASSRTQLPILNNILFRTDGTRLLVAAMNMEIASTQFVGAKISTPGAITVPARLVSDFVSSLPKGTIELQVKGTQLHISSGKYSSVINGLGADDFPELPVIDEEVAVRYSIAVSDFKQAVAQTIVTTSNDATRPVLTGVYWHSHEGALYLAGTDGYRLAERRLVETTSEVAAIVPTTSLQEALRTITDDIKEIEVLFDESQVRFRFDEAEVTSQLISGNFPPYRQLIPEKTETTVTLPRDEFVRITKIAGLFARDSGGSVTIRASEETKLLSLHSVASELGENTSEADATIAGGGSVTLNSRYLSEALGVLDGSTVIFGFSGKLAPTVLTTSGEDVKYKHIIMPLKS
ncbi:DNA polymerase III subunit beta [Candidatus Mycosynbacter amalyticus]|uniref:Beta sliding clamp n=1 Tax=Candidatus Mycosynbacter amalyticus TaxID=2665156 RepID=A0A857MKW6_9BACT|nr:DNA polymerase III subunit beta [Candidatus Mycosynbacter amalyticus]QHN42252.1 DNA polymerase III subunit beta [Candidatus Mycosynbacter amalyticus]